ncbi:MAG: endopeptidase [Acidimicrobiia bacterium]|nr:endopeptidase [Acidimicrobiia bacterium]
MDARDEAVTNGIAVDSTAEEPPESGGARPETDDGMELVEGYDRPEPAVTEAAAAGPDTAGVDPTLERYRVDIGNASFGTGLTPETVHGPDDRRQITGNTNDYPWRVHCSLLITAADNSTWIGTGWFVSPRLLVTAGHCVFINGSAVPGQNGWVNKIRVIPGRDGSVKPFGETTSTTFYTVKGWSEQGDPEWDYGAIALDEPLGNQTGWFGFGVYRDSDLRDTVANISGYPSDQATGTQWYAARKIDSVGPRKVSYDIDTAGGQSGAAVYRIKNGSRYGVAVHAYGGARVNSGTRINKAVFDNISKWKADHN